MNNTTSKRIAFVELTHIFSNQIKLPYSTGCIWSYCRTDKEITDNYSFDVNDWVYVLDGDFDYSATARKLAECDIIATSYFVWNEHASDRLCAEIKKINPNCLIIYGGLNLPHPNRCKKFLKDKPFIDVAVHNEGETGFKHILKALLHEQDLSMVKGITTPLFQNGGDRERIKDIKTLPSPYLDGLFDDLLEIKDYPYEWEGLVELSRGCPYMCTFCETGDRHWTKVHRQDNDKLIKEIDWIADKKIEYLHLIDNNFGMFKDHKIISDLLIDTKKSTGYPDTLNITWAKHKKAWLFDIAEDLWKVGLNKSVTIALQSMNDDTLKAIERSNENTNLKEVIDYLKSRGVPCYIETILGLPEESLHSFKEGLFRLIDDIDYHNYIGIYIMVALPQTPFGDPEYCRKYNVLIKQTSPAFFHHEHPPDQLLKDTNSVVVGSSNMTFDEYLDASGWKWFMISLHFLGWLRILALELKNNHNISMREFYNGLFEWFNENDKSLLYREYTVTMRLLKKVFDREIPWGRKVPGASNIYWEYEEATAIHIAKEKDRFYGEIGDYLKDEYGFNHSIVDTQYNKMKDPYEVYNGNLEKWARECMWWGRRTERFFV
tara:strand:- start:6310 stop:8118 length:1809 start_codon:yes stop_codon:yes gene_type:complete